MIPEANTIIVGTEYDLQFLIRFDPSTQGNGQAINGNDSNPLINSVYTNVDTT